MGKKSKKQKREWNWSGQHSQQASVLERACLFVIRWGVYLMLFSPLIVLKTSFFPFVTPKTIYFRVLVEIIFGAWLLLALACPRYRPRIKNPLFIALSVFLLVLILTSFTGINLARSFWSTYERMTGLFTWLHLFALFVVLTSTFRKRKDWQKILAVSVFAGLLLSFYFLFSDKISLRSGGTIGNTSFMAAYLLFDLFFALILFLTSLPPRSFENKLLAGYSLFSLFFICWSFFTSSARGAIYSSFIGIFLLLLGCLLFSQKRLLKRAGLSLILLLIVAGAVLAVLQPGFLRIDWYVSQMEPRLAVWGIGWQTAKERPFLGWGPENFIVGFSRYFNPCLFLGRCGGEIWFDRVHNIILDTLTTSGITGLLSYLAVFIITIIYLLLRLKRTGKAETPNHSETEFNWRKIASLGIIALLPAYFLQNLLVFDMINSYLVFLLVLALAGFLIQPERTDLPAPPDTGKKNRRILLLASPCIIFLAVLFYFGNLQPLRTAKATAMTVALAADPARSLAFFQESLNSWMLKYEPREHFAQKLPQLDPGSIQDKEALRQAFDAAEDEMEKSIAENPLDFRHHLFLGRLEIGFYYFERDQEKLARGREVLEKAIELGPSNQQGYWYLAELNFAEQKYGEAIELLKKAVALEPGFGLSHWYLSLAYQLSQNPGLALEAALAAKNADNGYDWKNNPKDINNMLNVYAALRDTAGIISLYQEAIERHPKEEQFYFGLADIYRQLREANRARELMDKLLEVRPELSEQVKEFLR